MEVPKIKVWDEAGIYLDMLAQTVINDVVPLLNTPGGAPHAIAREIFCYIDYLGALYTGKDPAKDELQPVRLRFIKYMKEVMREVDGSYSRWAEVIYNMYRNGPVHEFDPKLLQNKEGKFLGWFSYRGARYNQLVHCEGHSINVSHLNPFPSWWDPNFYLLPVSTFCLIQDLLSSIEKFKKALREPSARIQPWNEAATILNRAEYRCDFDLP